MRRRLKSDGVLHKPSLFEPYPQKAMILPPHHRLSTQRGGYDLHATYTPPQVNPGRLLRYVRGCTERNVGEEWDQKAMMFQNHRFSLYSRVPRLRVRLVRWRFNKAMIFDSNPPASQGTSVKTDFPRTSTTLTPAPGTIPSIIASINSMAKGSTTSSYTSVYVLHFSAQVVRPRGKGPGFVSRVRSDDVRESRRNVIPHCA